MIVDQLMSFILYLRILQLLRDLFAVVSHKLVALFEQSDGLAGLQIIQEEEAGIHIAQLWHMRAQSLAQKRIEIAASLLSDVVDIAFAQRQFVMSVARAGRLNVLLARLQITIMSQTLQLIVNSRLLNKV